MTDEKNMGLYRKFEVKRHDPSGKHANCFYFVLDVDHDKCSVAALNAYATACEQEYPALATDLRGIAKAASIKHYGTAVLELHGRG